MSVIDIIIGALILYGVVKGLFKGLFVEVTSLLALLVGVYGAVHFSNYAAEILLNNFCLLYTSPSPRDVEESRMPSSA